MQYYNFEWNSYASNYLPTVEYGCLEAILLKTSFQLGLAKCVLTCDRKTMKIAMFQLEMRSL